MNFEEEDSQKQKVMDRLLFVATVTRQVGIDCMHYQALVVDWQWGVEEEYLLFFATVVPYCSDCFAG